MVYDRVHNNNNVENQNETMAILWEIQVRKNYTED